MKIGMIGYSGKMGSLVYDYLKKKGHEFIFLCDKNNLFKTNLLSKDIDALIDFSIPSVSKKVIKESLRHRIPVISGTTGIKNKDKEEFNRLAIENNVGIYLVSNFLLSISKLQLFLHEIYPDYEYCYIDETHHLSKLDSPSGTALLFKEALGKEKEVTITSKRVNIFMYSHCIDLYSDYDHLRIEHNVYDKKGYAKGVEHALEHIFDFVGLKETL